MHALPQLVDGASYFLCRFEGLGHPHALLVGDLCALESDVASLYRTKIWSVIRVAAIANVVKGLALFVLAQATVGMVELVLLLDIVFEVDFPSSLLTGPRDVVALAVACPIVATSCGSSTLRDA